MRESLVTNVTTRFEYVEKDDIFGFAAILDPNYGLSWLQQNERSEWLGKLEEVLVKMERTSGTSDLAASINRSTLSMNQTTGWFDSFSEPSNVAEMQAKIQKYLLLVESDRELFRKAQVAKVLQSKATNPHAEEFLYMDCIDPCAFWKRASELPELKTLAKLARKLLGIPASSASIERVFSQTGFIMRQHRNRLEDRLCESLFFLKCNKKIMLELIGNKFI